MVDLVTVGLGAATGALTGGVLKGPFETLTHVWHYVYGHKWEAKAEERKNKLLKNLESLQNDIVAEIQNIPEENLQEPQFSIVGPALEASKFYIDEDEIRIMFAKLIASSMNSSKNDYTHHAFVEIIKMLSPLDAKNLYHLSKSDVQPIAKFIVTNTTEDTLKIIGNNIYLSNTDIQNEKIIEPSIDNLLRLGLVTITYEEYLKDDSQYDKYKNHPTYKEISEALERDKSERRDIIDVLQKSKDLVFEDGTKLPEELLEQTRSNLQELLSHKITIIKGIIRLTSFGRNFCSVCLSKLSTEIET